MRRINILGPQQVIDYRRQPETGAGTLLTLIVDLQKFVNDNLTAVANEAGKTLAVARGSLGTLTEQLTNETLVQIGQTLAELEVMLSLVSQRLELSDPLMYELLTTLREVQGVTHSMRDLTDYLEEHPEALIRGKTDDE